MQQHQLLHVCFTSLFLACKVEEKPRRLQDILRVFDRILHRRYAPPAQPSAFLPLSSPYPALQLDSPRFQLWRDTLVTLELSILAALGYSLYITHPQRLVLHLLNVVAPPAAAQLTPALAAVAFGALNDCMLLPLCCLHPPHVLAVAAIAVATAELGLQPQAGLQWVRLFDVEEELVLQVVQEMAHVWEAEGRLGADYAAAGADDDELVERRAAGAKEWQLLRRTGGEDGSAEAEESEEEEDELELIRRIAMAESLKTLRDAGPAAHRQ